MTEHLDKIVDIAEECNLPSEKYRQICDLCMQIHQSLSNSESSNSTNTSARSQRYFNLAIGEFYNQLDMATKYLIRACNYAYILILLILITGILEYNSLLPVLVITIHYLGYTFIIIYIYSMLYSIGVFLRSIQSNTNYITVDIEQQ